jgi:hypothetical protein
MKRRIENLFFEIRDLDVCPNCKIAYFVIEENGIAQFCDCDPYMAKSKIFFTDELKKAILKELMEDLDK